MSKKKSIEVFDFQAGEMITEKIPAENILRFLYNNNSLASSGLKYFISRLPIVSSLVGYWMKMPWTKRDIHSFIKIQDVKIEDFLEEDYQNFNDFFIRKLKPNARKFSHQTIICPCDGRHLFYQDISKIDGFYVKGQTISLEKLLNDSQLASLYKEGSMIISRLAPKDYHRFHFPCDGSVVSKTLVNGSLFSVNPIALRENLNILTENKRIVLKIRTKNHGNILQILVGATNVGSMHITAKENTSYKKGDELGFFSFGGSMVITLFPKASIQLSKKLLTLTENKTETLMLTGSSILQNE